MAALRNRCGYYIFVLFLSILFPRLISAVTVYHTSTHDVVLVRI